MRYRRKPGVVDAVRYTGENLAEVAELIGPHARAEAVNLPGPGRGMHAGLRLRTLDATMSVSTGGYVVREGNELRCASGADFERDYEPDAAHPGDVVDVKGDVLRAIAEVHHLIRRVHAPRTREKPGA